MVDVVFLSYLLLEQLLGVGDGFQYGSVLLGQMEQHGTAENVRYCVESYFVTASVVNAGVCVQDKNKAFQPSDSVVDSNIFGVGVVADECISM